MDPSYSTPIRNFTFAIKAPIWNFMKLTALICSHWRYFFQQKRSADDDADTDARNKGWENLQFPKGKLKRNKGWETSTFPKGKLKRN